MSRFESSWVPVDTRPCIRLRMLSSFRAHGLREYLTNSRIAAGDVCSLGSAAVSTPTVAAVTAITVTTTTSATGRVVVGILLGAHGGFCRLLGAS